MKFLTQEEKAEFIDRCKKLAVRDGKRIQYYPSRYKLVDMGLWIVWGPDEDFLNVRLRLPNLHHLTAWSEVVEQFKGRAKWGYVHKLRHHLILMRGMMVLQDLADV